MVLGLDTFALDVFATARTSEVEYWNEICPAKTEWVLIPADRVNINRCIEDGT